MADPTFNIAAAVRTLVEHLGRPLTDAEREAVAWGFQRGMDSVTVTPNRAQPSTGQDTIPRFLDVLECDRERYQSPLLNLWPIDAPLAKPHAPEQS